MNKRHQIIPSSYVIFKRKNKILLSRRFQTGYMDGFYSLPAGHCEANESFVNCAVREAKEEVGAIISPKHLKLGHMMHRYTGKHSVDARIDFFYICDKWRGILENKEPEKCDELLWVDIKKIPKNTIPYIRLALKNCFNEKSIQEV